MNAPFIRAANPEDADIVYSFIHKLAEYEKQPDAVKISVTALRSYMELQNPPFECLIAENSSGKAIGFALFFPTFSTWEGPGIWLEDVYVEEDARLQGVGKALLERLIELALERDCARLEWTVLDWNERARNFYGQMSAFPLNDWTTWRLNLK